MPQTFDDDTRLYVIGDVHGRLDLIGRAIQAIERDVAGYTGPALTVTLGAISIAGHNRAA